MIENFEYIDRLVNHFSSEQSRFQFLGTSKEYFELCLDYLELRLSKNYGENINQNIYSLIHQTIEKSKAVLLLRETRINKSHRLISEMYEYKKLLAKADYIENALEVPGSADKSALELELLRVNEELKVINKQLSSGNNLLKVCDLDSLRSLSIMSNFSYINYFIGKSRVFALHTANGKMTFLPVGKSDEIITEVKHYFLYLKYTSAAEKYNFSEYARLLYDKLLLPLSPLNADINISPDGILCNLPFDALMTHDFNKSHPFLISTHNICYSYSFSLMQMQSNSEHIIQKSLFVLPAIKQNGNKNAESSILNSFKNLDYTIFDSSTPEKSQLIEEMKKHQLIHFSGHASAFDSIQHGPALYVNNYSIPLSEIEQEKLNANLITLSACETMMGNEVTGEGMLSINRGFVLSGVNATLASQWKVNEGSTAKIIEKFYKNLLNGDRKNNALTFSKRHFLANCADYQTAPYYWAGMVLTGNHEALIFEEKFLSKFQTILAGSLIFLLISGVYMTCINRKKSKKVV